MKEKADMFMKPGIGKRKATVDLKTYTLISRQRFDRIFKGNNFELTAQESKTITELFNISSDYFKKRGELILIHEITKEDWQCFFSQQYGKDSIEKIQKPPKQIVEGMEKVESTLKVIVKKGYIPDHYDTKTALYHIHYFFENGATFKEASTFSRFLECLELLKISDWKELADHPEEMKKYLYLLRRHYKYVNSYIKCRELENIN